MTFVWFLLNPAGYGCQCSTCTSLPHTLIQLSGVLRSPLSWNAEREWSFSLSFRQPILYLLRDHINMFADLARDWISGPPIDNDRFVPVIYTFQLEMHQYETFLYANDQNIIDKPLVHDDNGELVCRNTSSYPLML